MAGLQNLDLNSMGSLLNNQDALAEQRRVAEAAALERQQQLTSAARERATVVNSQSMQAAEATRNEQLEVLGGVDEQVQMAQRAIALSDSDNPLDRLELWTLQQTNKGYTREGNLERLGYLQAASQALGAKGVIQQQGFADLLNQVQLDLDNSLASDTDRLAILSLTEKQGQERIDAQVNYQNARLGILQTNHAMQEVALANMDSGMVETALLQAQNSESGTANVGGIELSAAAIDARKSDLIEREYLTQVRQFASQDLLLGEMTTPQLNEMMQQASANEGFVEIEGTRISLARIQDAAMKKTTNDVQLNSAMTTLMRQNDEKFAQRMSPTELNTAITNGGQIPGYPGRIDIDILKGIRDIKAEANMQGIQNEMIMGTTTNPMQAVAENSQYVSQMLDNAPANSPLTAMLRNEQTIARTTAMLVDSDDPMRVATGMEAITASRTRIDSAILAESERLGGGDKYREEAWNYRLRGQPIPERVVVDAIMESKGNPSVDWMEPATQGIFRSSYQNAMAELNTAGYTGVNMSQSEKVQQATMVALEATKQQVAGNLWTEITGFQFEAIPGVPTNPLASAGLGAREFTEIVRQADMKGAQVFAQSSGATPEQMAAYMNGSQANPDLARMQTAQVLIALDAKQPGLAKKYMEWWDSNAREQMGSAYINGKAASAGQNFSRASELALVLPGVQDDLGTYASLLQSGYQEVYAQELHRQHNDFVTFGGDAVAKQVFLLGIDSNMNDLQRQRAMSDVIIPLTTEASNMGLTGNDLQAYVDTQLSTRKWETSEKKGLAQLILKNRHNTLGVADRYAESQTLWNRGLGNVPMIGNMIQGQDMVTQQTNNFGWWRAIAPK